ncbi:hypothetical protein L6R50_08925 [Myxococcota bacterium]|nr:hypothetical protein [Myxococcota bacterium]
MTGTGEPTFAVAAFASAHDTVPRRLQVTWLQLVRALTTFRVFPVTDKRQLPAWSPVLYRDEARRGRGWVEAVSCLVLDYDGGTSLDEAVVAWRDWPHVLHTSWSHTPDSPRFRVVLPLEEPVPAPEWPWAWESARQWYRGTTPDPVCKDVARLYFRPALRAPDWPHEARVNDVDRPLLRLEWTRPPPRPAPVLPPRGPWTVSWSRRRAVLYAVLAREPDARRRAADLVGAAVRDGIARGGTCPQCGRPDVWWPVVPERPMGARCNHARSCGWRGSLVDLVEAAGGGVDALLDGRSPGGSAGSPAGRNPASTLGFVTPGVACRE